MQAADVQDVTKLWRYDNRFYRRLAKTMCCVQSGLGVSRRKQGDGGVENLLLLFAMPRRYLERDNRRQSGLRRHT